MATRAAELAAAWLLKAEHDLENARLLIRDEKRLLDLAAYHCQQAAEKAIKAYLTRQDTIFPKTHVLAELLDLCVGTEGGFSQFQQHAEVLSPLVHQFRYPGDVEEPTESEANEALKLAEEIYRFCERQLRELKAEN